MDSRISEFEESVRVNAHEAGVPSIAFGIARSGETLSLGATGLADKALFLESNTGTPYALASVTKPMTATVVTILAERGLLDVDAPINDYLGDSKIQSRVGNAEDATVRRVADHTAGLPLHYQFYYEDEPYRRPPIDVSINRYAKTFTEPGERHCYSNLGYGLLESVIERITGEDYGSAMRDELFRPLGMSQSFIGPEIPASVAMPAVAYGPDGVGYPPYDFDHPGGSAAFASVEDLLAFGNVSLGFGPELLSDSARVAMQERTAILPEKRGYGFGWGINEDRFGLRYVQHTGGMGGVSTVLRLVPELDLVIAVLTNTEAGLIMTMADDATALFSPDFQAGLIGRRVAKASTPKPRRIHKSLQGNWKGSVETFEGDREISLSIRNGLSGTAWICGVEAELKELQMQDGFLIGVFDGDIRTSDAAKRPYVLRLDLKLRRGALCGAIVAVPRPGPSGAGPDLRVGNALSMWAVLNPIRE